MGWVGFGVRWGEVGLAGIGWVWMGVRLNVCLGELSWVGVSWVGLALGGVGGLGWCRAGFG